MNSIARPRSRTLVATTGGMFVLALLALAVLPASRCEAGGLSVIVNTLVDENDGIGVGGVSLRDAITAAVASPSAENITFSVTGTITLSSALPTITDTLLIIGPGETQLIVDANSTGRPFMIASTGTLTVSNLEIRNGAAQGGAGGSVDTFTGAGGGAAGMGGAFFVNGGELVLINVTLRGNDAVGGQGGATTGFGTGFGGGGGGVGTGGGDGDSGTGGSGGVLGADGQGGAGGVSGPGSVGGSFGGGGGGGGNTDGGFAGGAAGFGGGGGGGAGTAAGGVGGLHGGPGGTPTDGFGEGGGGGGGLGGAIFLRSGTLALTNVHFVSNTAMKGSGLNGGGDGQGKGGAIYVFGGTVDDGGSNTFQGNTATDHLASPGDDDHVFGTTVVPVEVRAVEVD